MNQILDLQAEATAKDFVSKKSEKKKSPKEKDSSKKNKKINQTIHLKENQIQPIPQSRTAPTRRLPI